MLPNVIDCLDYFRGELQESPAAVTAGLYVSAVTWPSYRPDLLNRRWHGFDAADVVAADVVNDLHFAVGEPDFYSNARACLVPRDKSAHNITLPRKGSC